MYQTLFYYSFITLYKLAIVSIISTCKMEATQWLLCAGYELSILFTFAEKYSKYQLLDFDICFKYSVVICNLRYWMVPNGYRGKTNLEIVIKQLQTNLL